MTMEPEVIDKIPFSPDLPGVLERLHIQPESEAALCAGRLVAEARALARPKAMCRAAYIESKADDSVVIEGVRFTSRVLRVNLEAANCVFAFLATCGRELEEWSGGLKDQFEQFWADEIKRMALGSAGSAVTAHITNRHQPGPSSTMNPGSLSDWPIDEQRPLFKLLGDPLGAIGVELTDSLLMVPTKSISGLRFPSEGRFENCQLCPRQKCPSRRAPYDKDLYDRKYAPGRGA